MSDLSRRDYFAGLFLQKLFESSNATMHSSAYDVSRIHASQKAWQAVLWADTLIMHLDGKGKKEDGSLAYLPSNKKQED